MMHIFCRYVCLMYASESESECECVRGGIYIMNKLNEDNIYNFLGLKAFD